MAGWGCPGALFRRMELGWEEGKDRVRYWGGIGRQKGPTTEKMRKEEERTKAKKGRGKSTKALSIHFPSKTRSSASYFGIWTAELTSPGQESVSVGPCLLSGPTVASDFRLFATFHYLPSGIKGHR